MLSFPPAVHIWLATAPTDLRKSFDTLAELVRQHLGEDPLSGHVFVFHLRHFINDVDIENVGNEAGADALNRVFAGLQVFISGCARKEPPADVTIINGNEPESLDPHIVTGVSELRLVKALFDGLVKLEPTNAAPVPALAASWPPRTPRSRSSGRRRTRRGRIARCS